MINDDGGVCVGQHQEQEVRCQEDSILNLGERDKGGGGGMEVGRGKREWSKLNVGSHERERG